MAGILRATAAGAVLSLLALPAAAEVYVEVVSPTASSPVFGPTPVVVRVHADERVATVDVVVDGSLVATLDTPPWEIEADFGQDNVEHHVRVVARTVSGRSGVGTVITPRIEVNEEVDVALQELYVTVSRSGQRVLDLEQGDFRVEDDGRRQEIVTFARGDVPITAVLLVDASESMQGERLGAALEGVQAFAGGMRALDEAMVMLFSDRLLAATPFTDSAPVLASSLAGVEPRGGTALNDHLWLGMRKLDARPGRRVVILLSDGADVLSSLSMQEVLFKARSSPALIYWIRLDDVGRGRTSFSSAWRDYDANRAELELLETAVAESGGRIVPIAGIGEIEHAFRTVLAELREQYVLGYYPTGAKGDGHWRKVNVEAKGFGLEVRARKGYFDY